jgi:hypothetical protein
LVKLDWRDWKQRTQRRRRPTSAAPGHFASVGVAGITQCATKPPRGLEVALAFLALGQICTKRHSVLPPAFGERLQELA